MADRIIPQLRLNFLDTYVHALRHLVDTIVRHKITDAENLDRLISEDFDAALLIHLDDDAVHADTSPDESFSVPSSGRSEIRKSNSSCAVARNFSQLPLPVFHSIKAQ